MRALFSFFLQEPQEMVSVAKLKAHHEITAVNGEPILYDAEAHDETRTPNLPA